MIWVGGVHGSEEVLRNLSGGWGNKLLNYGSVSILFLSEMYRRSWSLGRDILVLSRLSRRQLLLS